MGGENKTSSWHLIGFPYGSNIGSTVSCRGETHLYSVNLHYDVVNARQETRLRFSTKDLAPYSTGCCCLESNFKRFFAGRGTTASHRTFSPSSRTTLERRSPSIITMYQYCRCERIATTARARNSLCSWVFSVWAITGSPSGSRQKMQGSEGIRLFGIRERLTAALMLWTRKIPETCVTKYTIYKERGKEGRGRLG